MKGIGFYALSVDGCFKMVQCLFARCLHGFGIIVLWHQRNECHFVIEVVEDDDVAIQDVKHIGCIVLLHGGVFHRNVFKVAHRVEGSVSI